MAEWKAVGAEMLLDDGAMTEVRIDGARILLARVHGSYYAVQAFCSHMGGNLMRGGLDGFVVSCPRNVSKFDIRDGHVVTWLSRMPGIVRRVAQGIQPPKGLRTYPIRVQDGRVWVEIG